MCFRIWLTRLDLRQGAILVSLRVEVWTPEHPKEFLVWLLAQSLAFTVDALPHGLVLRKWGWNSLVSFLHAHTYMTKVGSAALYEQFCMCMHSSAVCTSLVVPGTWASP